MEEAARAIGETGIASGSAAAAAPMTVSHRVAINSSWTHLFELDSSSDHVRRWSNGIGGLSSPPRDLRTTSSRGMTRKPTDGGLGLLTGSGVPDFLRPMPFSDLMPGIGILATVEERAARAGSGGDVGRETV